MATASIILGLLLIICGISLFSTPLSTFLSLGYYVIILFLVSGIFGIIKAISQKKYDKEFWFSILGVILGIIGFAVPGAAAMNDMIILYLAACWLLVRGIISFMDAYRAHKDGDGLGAVILNVILGILDVALCIYSALNPASLAIALGFLVGFFFIESGVHMIVVAGAVSNVITVIFTIVGILSIIAGFALCATPLTTFWKTGYFIIALFFTVGVIGIVKGIMAKRYDREFFFAILSLILGVIGLVVPGVGDMNSSILLYMVACWFIVRGILVIVRSVQAKKNGGETGMMVLGIIMGVLDILLGIFSIVYPVFLGITLGFLIGFYFIESGLNMIILGMAIEREQEAAVVVVDVEE